MTHSLSSYRRAFATALALLTLSVPIASSAAQTSPAFDQALEKGEALAQEGNYKAAIKALKKAEKLSTEPSVRLFLDLATCHNRIGDYEVSESYARRALELAEDPADQAGAYNLLGLSLLAGFSSETLTEAEAAFRKVLELTDGQANMARYSLGEVLKRQGRYEEAHAGFAEYLEREADGQRSAQARRAMEWILCVQTVSPIRVEGDVKRPEKFSWQSPPYTEEALLERVQGTVILEAVVDGEGFVRCVNILQSLPKGLTEAAVEAASRWKLKPATLHGEPVAVIYNLTINFRLQK